MGVRHHLCAAAGDADADLGRLVVHTACDCKYSRYDRRVYTFSARKIRLTGMLINSPLWILYDIAVGSYAGILDEMVSEASMLISIIRFGWKNMDAFEQSP